MKDDSVISSRSGQYVRQMEGYRAFLPLPLPPKPPVQITGELQNLLSQADRALGRLDGSIQILPSPNLFLFMCVRKEAVLSSQIEGMQSSLRDVLEAEAKILAADRPQDANESLNYIEAMNHGLKCLEKLPVSVRLIREIHAKLLRHTRGFHLNPGELRTRQNWIGPVGCGLDEAEFVPPPPNEVPVALGKLEAFLHNPGDCPALIWIGMAHAQFETIHPFLDGNGRVGRLLITFLLCEQKILLQPVLYLSSFFKRRRPQYYEKLQSVRDNGAWEEWIAFFLRGIAEVSQEATDTVRAVLALREKHRRLITDKLGRAAANGHCVLEYLYKHPIVRVSHVQNWIGASYPAANNLVARMANCGILEEFTGHSRNRAFRYRDYIQLFHKGTERNSRK